mgnify:FL=1
MASYKPIVVMANGVFDIFHIGHLLYLQEARRMGDKLVVSITDDAHVNKGPGRPLFNAHQRAAIIHELRCVDDVLIVPGALEALEIVRPDIFVKGADYVGKIEERHSEYCKANDIKIRFTNQPLFSTTEIINARLGSR